jgi:hypothetical protein
MILPWVAAGIVAGVGVGAGVGWRTMRRRSLDRWLLPYLRQGHRRRPPARGEPVHLLLCVADHYEPLVGKPRPSAAVGWARVERWLHEYPRALGGFRDSDGRPPRHSFFFPPEEYAPEYLDALAELCRRGFGEVEIHIHHDKDTADGLRKTLVEWRDLLSQRHGLLSRRRDTGELVYGFIHGNWALCNSRPDGRWCGVDNELDVLRETGCYADFTLPSAPSATQTSKINSIYYACNRPGPRSHETGMDAGSGKPPANALLLIQGPLLLDWRRRKWGLIPHIENACLQDCQPPHESRIDTWLRARVQVPSRPDWFFVKLHTHGAPEWNADVLLGEPAVRFHEALARRAAADPNFHFHYVSAREMYNLARAAEAGWTGSVADARDFELVPNVLAVPPDAEGSRGARVAPAEHPGVCPSL